VPVKGKESNVGDSQDKGCPCRLVLPQAVYEPERQEILSANKEGENIEGE
jgi:hypothetical protein